MKYYKLLLILTLLLFFAARSFSQEIQVPFDNNGLLIDINKQSEEKLHLFTDYNKFEKACIFKTADSLYVLEIYFLKNNQRVRIKKNMSAAEYFAFRQKVTHLLQYDHPSEILDQSGRNKWLIGTMTLSLGYYGWALPLTANVHDRRLAVALYMVTGSTGFYLPYSISKNISVTRAQAVLSLYGGSRGILHGISLALIFKHPGERGIIGSGILISLAELTAGFKIAKSKNMSAGSAYTIGTGGDFGYILGFQTAHLAGFIDAENRQMIMASTLMGSGTGLLLGNFLASNSHYTVGDAKILYGIAFLGGYLPIAVVDDLNLKNDKLYSAASMAGIITGIALGHHLQKERDFSEIHGNLVVLSEAAGGLLGLGMAYLISSNNSDNSGLYLTASSLGATAGFWLMYSSVAKKAQIENNKLSLNLSLIPQKIPLDKKGMFATAKPVPTLKLTCSF